MKPSHKSESCRLQFLSCVECNKKHNVALCERSNRGTPETVIPSHRRTVYNSIARIDDQPKTQEILLQCAMGDVSNTKEVAFYSTCLLFDGCSQRSYVTVELKRQLNLQTIRTESIILKTFSAKEGCLQ